MTQPTTATLKPGPGLVVRDPDTREPLRADGESKPITTYWARRLVDCDVQLVEPDSKLHQA